jgi:hypothetical protein
VISHSMCLPIQLPLLSCNANKNLATLSRR